MDVFYNTHQQRVFSTTQQYCCCRQATVIEQADVWLLPVLHSSTDVRSRHALNLALSVRRAWTAACPKLTIQFSQVLSVTSLVLYRQRTLFKYRNCCLRVHTCLIWTRLLSAGWNWIYIFRYILYQVQYGVYDTRYDIIDNSLAPSIIWSSATD